MYAFAQFNDVSRPSVFGNGTVNLDGNNNLVYMSTSNYLLEFDHSHVYGQCCVYDNKFEMEATSNIGIGEAKNPHNRYAVTNKNEISYNGREDKQNHNFKAKTTSLKCDECWAEKILLD